MKIKNQKRRSGKTSFIINQAQWSLLIGSKIAILSPNKAQSDLIRIKLRNEVTCDEYRRCLICTFSCPASSLMNVLLSFRPSNVYIDEYTQMKIDVFDMINARFGDITIAVGTLERSN
jgi:hypothetical protein